MKRPESSIITDTLPELNCSRVSCSWKILVSFQKTEFCSLTLDVYCDWSIRVGPSPAVSRTCPIGLTVPDDSLPLSDRASMMLTRIWYISSTIGPLPSRPGEASAAPHGDGAARTKSADAAARDTGGESPLRGLFPFFFPIFPILEMPSGVSVQVSVVPKYTYTRYRRASRNAMRASERAFSSLHVSDEVSTKWCSVSS